MYIESVLQVVHIHKYMCRHTHMYIIVQYVFIYIYVYTYMYIWDMVEPIIQHHDSQEPQVRPSYGPTILAILVVAHPGFSRKSLSALPGDSAVVPLWACHGVLLRDGSILPKIRTRFDSPGDDDAPSWGHQERASS